MLATEFEKKLAFDLRASWQVRAVANVKGPFRAVLLSVIAHTYEAAGVVAVLTLVDPDFDGNLPAPVLLSCGKIDRHGWIVADVGESDGSIRKDRVIFMSELQMRDRFRELADRLKLNDTDRTELFKCAQRWVVADRRLDPNFDPKDPDAKRLH